MLKSRKGRVRVNWSTLTRINARFIKAGDQDGETDDPADKSELPENPFVEEPLRSLWEQGLDANNRY